MNFNRFQESFIKEVHDFLTAALAACERRSARNQMTPFSTPNRTQVGPKEVRIESSSHIAPESIPELTNGDP